MTPKQPTGPTDAECVKELRFLIADVGHVTPATLALLDRLEARSTDSAGAPIGTRTDAPHSIGYVGHEPPAGVTELLRSAREWQRQASECGFYDADKACELVPRLLAALSATRPATASERTTISEHQEPKFIIAAEVRELLYRIVRQLVDRIESCGASPRLTHAVCLASDLAAAIGNARNPAAVHEFHRLMDTLETPMPGAPPAAPAACPACGKSRGSGGTCGHGFHIHKPQPEFPVLDAAAPAEPPARTQHKVTDDHDTE